MYAENRLHEYKQLTFTSAFVILSDFVQISSVGYPREFLVYQKRHP